MKTPKHHTSFGVLGCQNAKKKKKKALLASTACIKCLN